MENKEEWIVLLDKNDIPTERNVYSTKEEAISAGKEEIRKISAKYINSEIFYVGKVSRPKPRLFAENIIDDLISGAESMYGDTADNFLEYVSKKHKEELEREVNKVVGEWIDNHDFMTCGFLVEKIEKIEV